MAEVKSEVKKAKEVLTKVQKESKAVADARAKFARALTHFREKDGRTQYRLALDVGITPGYMSLMEDAQRSPSFEMLVRLAAELKIKSTDLLG
jgi:DNA-binding XRE family transcriptional regulator